MTTSSFIPPVMQQLLEVTQGRLNERVSFETMSGEGCLRLCIRTSYDSFVDRPYAPQDYGHSTEAQLRETIVIFLEGRGIHYNGHVKPSKFDFNLVD